MLDWLTDEQCARREMAALARRNAPVADGGAAGRQDNRADVCAHTEGAVWTHYAIIANRLMHGVAAPAWPAAPVEQAA